MSKPVGFGIFMWGANERRTNRYGAFFMSNTNYHNTVTVDALLNPPASLLGKRVMVWCKVAENRESGHIGDAFLDLLPTMPDKGDIILIGVGILDIEPLDNDESITTVVLRPNDDRKTFWIDPRNLYKLHDQTVELFIEPTAEDFSEIYSGNTKTGIIFNRDGCYFQTKGIPFDVKVELGDGPYL